jgi:hypothetical protein
MQLEQALKQIQNHPWIDVRIYDWLIILTHVDEDYKRDVDEDIEPFLKLENYYVHMYSSVPSQPAIFCLIEKYSNFRYTHVPELLFTQLIDHHMEVQEFVSYNAKKVFCNLNNRYTIFREDIFQHMRNNYSDISYLSWNSDPYYKNFNEEKYVIEYYKNYNYPVTGFIFDIFAETYLETFVGLTEKTTKGYLNGCIPVPFSTTGTMQLLKNLGFDIFEDIVDFSYEMETNNQVRMEFYYKEIDRLSNTDLNITKSLTDRFTYNRQCFLDNIEKAKHKLKWIDKKTQISLDNRKIYLGY